MKILQRRLIGFRLSMTLWLVCVMAMLSAFVLMDFIRGGEAGPEINKDETVDLLKSSSLLRIDALLKSIDWKGKPPSDLRDFTSAFYHAHTLNDSRVDIVKYCDKSYVNTERYAGHGPQFITLRHEQPSVHCYRKDVASKTSAGDPWLCMLSPTRQKTLTRIIWNDSEKACYDITTIELKRGKFCLDDEPFHIDVSKCTVSGETKVGGRAEMLNFLLHGSEL